MKKTIEIETFYKLIGGINQLGIEVGTNAPKGGDAGAGGRTFIKISDEGGTSWKATVDGEEDFSDPASISITLGGDSELNTLIQALEFALAVLKKQEHDGEAKSQSTVL